MLSLSGIRRHFLCLTEDLPGCSALRASPTMGGTGVPVVVKLECSEPNAHVSLAFMDAGKKGRGGGVLAMVVVVVAACL